MANRAKLGKILSATAKQSKIVSVKRRKNKSLIPILRFHLYAKIIDINYEMIETNIEKVITVLGSIDFKYVL